MAFHPNGPSSRPATSWPGENTTERPSTFICSKQSPLTSSRLREATALRQRPGALPRCYRLVAKGRPTRPFCVGSPEHTTRHDTTRPPANPGGSRCHCNFPSLQGPVCQDPLAPGLHQTNAVDMGRPTTHLHHAAQPPKFPPLRALGWRRLLVFGENKLVSTIFSRRSPSSSSRQCF